MHFLVAQFIKIADILDVGIGKEIVAYFILALLNYVYCELYAEYFLGRYKFNSS